MKKLTLKWLLGALMCAGSQTATAALPELTTDSSNPHYYLIKNMRTDDNNRGDRGGGETYAVAPGVTGQIKLRTPGELNSTEGRYELGALWYFKSAEGVSAQDGYTAVNIYNALTGEALAQVNYGTWALKGPDVVWYLNENSQNVTQNGVTYTYSGFNILHAQNKTNDSYGWNNASNAGQNISYWKGNDGGSIWDFEVVDEGKANATIEAINQTSYADYITPLVTNGNAITALTQLFSNEAITAWQTAATNAGTAVKDVANYAATKAAYVDLLLSAVGKKVMMYNAADTKRYIAIKSDNSLGRVNSNVRPTSLNFVFEIQSGTSGIRFYSPVVEKYFVHNEPVGLTTNTKDATSYYFDVYQNQDGQVAVGIFDPTKTVNTQKYFHNNMTETIQRWQAGLNSSWYISVVSEDEEEAIRSISKGDALASLTGVVTDEAIAAWNTAKAGEYSEAKLAAMNQAFETMRSSVVDGVSIRIKASNNDYIGFYNQVNYRKWRCMGNESNGNRVFTLKKVDNGFKLYNEYAGMYLVHATGDNQNAKMTNNEANATVYKFDANYSGGIGFKANGVADNRAYIHVNTNNILRWEFSGNSQWVVEKAEAADAESEALAGAIYYAESLTFGNELSQYYKSDEFTAALEAAKNDPADKRAAATALRDATHNVAAMPLADRTYVRLVGKSSDKYMSAVNNDNGRQSMIEKTPDLATNVFLYADGKFISLSEGKVMGKYLGGGNNQSLNWQMVLADTDQAGEPIVTPEPLVNRSTIYDVRPLNDPKYLIEASSGRYLHGAGDQVNCGDGNGDGYYWNIEKVTWLPIAFGEGHSHTSVYSARPLHWKDGYNTGRAKPYTGKVNGGKMELTPILDERIPANTPVVLQILTTEGTANGNVFLEIDYTEPAEAEISLMSDDNSTLQGSYLATSKAEGTTYYVVNKAAEEEETKYHQHTTEHGDYIPGSVAHLALTGENLPTSFAFVEAQPSGIEAVGADVNSANVEWFDLSGRRVAAPSKGVYIRRQGSEVSKVVM